MPTEFNERDLLQNILDAPARSDAITSLRRMVWERLSNAITSIDSNGDFTLATQSISGASLNLAADAADGSTANPDGIAITVTSGNGTGVANGIRISTASDLQDQGSGITMSNTGAASTMYMNVVGRQNTPDPTNGEYPQGLGIDMNLANATWFKGFGLEIYNWTAVDQGDVAMRLLNQVATATSRLIELRTSANAIQCNPIDDTSGSLDSVQIKVDNAAGTVSQCTLGRNGYGMFRGGLTIQGVVANNRNPANIATATTGGSSVLEIRDTTPTTGQGKYIRANAGNLEIVNNAFAAVIVTINDTGQIVAAAAILSNSPTAGVGYSTGAGGTITQATSKSTGVTLNKVCGEITMNAAALAANTTVSFTLTNSALTATDVLVLNHVSGGTPGSYLLNASCASGSAVVDVRNITGGSLSEAIVIRFAVLRGVTS